VASGEAVPIWHIVWTAALSLITGLLALVLRLFSGGLEDKHRANTERLEAIIEGQEAMTQTLTEVQIDVAKLKERAGFFNGRHR